MKRQWTIFNTISAVAAVSGLTLVAYSYLLPAGSTKAHSYAFNGWVVFIAGIVLLLPFLFSKVKTKPSLPWSEIRKQGMNKYVFIEGTIKRGLPFSLCACWEGIWLPPSLEHSPFRVPATIFCCCVVGTLFSWFDWEALEKRYAKESA